MPETKVAAKVFRAVPEFCDGCRMCEMMCSLKHTGSINRYRARIKVINPEEGDCYPVICRHCKNPLCQSACPIPEAMVLDEQTGVVVINDSKCIRCLACVDACPFGAIQVGPDRELLKCDLCGGEPLCVKYCIPKDPPSPLAWAKQSCLQYVEPHKVAMPPSSKPRKAVKGA